MFSSLYRTVACDRQTDGQTDRQTDGQTDILPQHTPHYAYASCSKNAQYRHVTDTMKKLTTAKFSAV